MASFALQLARFFVWLAKSPELPSEEIKARAARRSYPSHASPTWRSKRAAEISEGSHRGQPVFELKSKASPSPKRRVLYLHGGGFVNPLHWAHWDVCAALTAALDASVTLPIYPLSPEHSLDECHEHLGSLYDELTQRPESGELIVCGDSAGGNLALALTLRAIQSGGARPARLILFSPWVDLSMSNPEIDRAQARDPMLSRAFAEEWGRWWAQGRELKDPLVSPLYAELSGLPPVELFLGSDDMLTPDALLLAEALRAAGVEVTQDVTQGAFHDFMTVTFAPEAKAVYEAIRLRAEGAL